MKSFCRPTKNRLVCGGLNEVITEKGSTEYNGLCNEYKVVGKVPLRAQPL